MAAPPHNTNQSAEGRRGRSSAKAATGIWAVRRSKANPRAPDRRAVTSRRRSRRRVAAARVSQNVPLQGHKFQTASNSRLSDRDRTRSQAYSRGSAITMLRAVMKSDDAALGMPFLKEKEGVAPPGSVSGRAA
jgi:hypothetical protein